MSHERQVLKPDNYQPLPAELREIIAGWGVRDKAQLLDYSYAIAGGEILEGPQALQLKAVQKEFAGNPESPLRIAGRLLQMCNNNSSDSKQLQQAAQQLGKMSAMEKEEQEAILGKKNWSDADIDTDKVLKMLEAFRALDLSGIGKSKSYKEVVSPTGTDVRIRPIQHLSELTRAQKRSWAYYKEAQEYWHYLLATKAIPVKQKIERVAEGKPQVFVLLDNTSSMIGPDPDLPSYLQGICAYLSTLLAKSQIEISAGTFSYSLHNVQLDLDSKTFYDYYMGLDYTKGGSHIGVAIKEALPLLGNSGVRDIMVITDGEDPGFKLTPQELGGVKMHLCQLGDSIHPPVAECAIRSGGKVFRFGQTPTVVPPVGLSSSLEQAIQVPIGIVESYFAMPQSLSGDQLRMQYEEKRRQDALAILGQTLSEDWKTLTSPQGVPGVGQNLLEEVKI